MQVLLTSQELSAIIKELAGKLAATYPELKDVIFIGIQQGGAVLGNDIIAALKETDARQIS